MKGKEKNIVVSYCRKKKNNRYKNEDSPMTALISYEKVYTGTLISIKKTTKAQRCRYMVIS